jgi:hypothetical protein
MNAPDSWPLDAVVGAINRSVAPYLGQTMAQAAVEAHRLKLGIDGARITAAQLDGLMNRMRMGLAVFVGREKTESIMQEAHAAIASLGAQT